MLAMKRASLLERYEIFLIKAMDLNLPTIFSSNFIEFFSFKNTIFYTGTNVLKIFYIKNKGKIV